MIKTLEDISVSSGFVSGSEKSKQKVSILEKVGKSVGEAFSIGKRYQTSSPEKTWVNEFNLNFSQLRLLLNFLHPISKLIDS
jgi:hypothetical protein